MVVDLGLKPSLAQFPFRVQPDEAPATGDIHEAESGDDALLAMIDSQAEVATAKCKAGGVKQAIQIMHRAYRIIENYIEGFPGTHPVPPAAMLAAATVRISLCMMLSSAQRHTQALDEAKMAAVETDKVWRMLFLASAEQEAATANGDRTKPFPALRDALRNPPQWLERAVETAVQARHCIGIELEFEERQRKEKRKLMSYDDLCAEENAKLGQDSGTDPVPLLEKLSVQEQIGKLHREGVSLARQLLPPKHPVRVRAEHTLDEWLQRTGGDGQPNLAPDEATRTKSKTKTGAAKKLKIHAVPVLRSGAAPDVAVVDVAPGQLPTAPLPSQALTSYAMRNRRGSMQPTSAPLLSVASAPSLADADLPCITRMYGLKRLPPRNITSVQTMTTSASVGSIGAPFDSISSSAYASQMLSGGDSYASQLDSLEVPKKAPAHSGSRDASPNSRQDQSHSDSHAGGLMDGPKPKQTKTLQQKKNEEAAALALKDPFEDWRRNMVNENQMSHFQRQLRSNDGLSDLQSGFKNQARIFRVNMKEMDDADLFDIRTKFGPAGMVVNKAQDKEKKQNLAAQQTEEGIQARSTNHDLFKHFGHAIPGDKPKQQLEGLTKLLTKSQTHGANLNKIAEAEKKRQADVEKQKRQAKFCKDHEFDWAYQRSKLKTPELPEDQMKKRPTVTDKAMVSGLKGLFGK